MSASEQLDAVQDAIAAIQEDGREIQIRTITRIGPSSQPELSFSDSPTYAIVSEAMQDEIDGTKVKKGDRRFLFYLAATVTTDNRIVDGGVVYSLGKVQEIKPGPVKILYRAWGRESGQ